MTNSESPLKNQFAKLPPAFREPLPGIDHAIASDPAAQESESADWGSVPAPVLHTELPTRRELRGDRELPAHATPSKLVDQR